MFVSEKEHDRDRIVQLVHLVEIGNFIDIDEIKDCKVLAYFGDFEQDFVLLHAFLIVVTTEPDDDEAIVFGHDGLVDVPAGVEVWEHVRHGCGC
jgi:hypothetical protein